MHANWKQRHNQSEDTRVGRDMDKLVELGIRFACLALHNEYGFGTQRIEHIRDTIEKYITVYIKSGAKPHTDAYRHNVEHGIDRVNEAYEMIFNKKKNAPRAGTRKGADEKTS